MVHICIVYIDEMMKMRTLVLDSLYMEVCYTYLQSRIHRYLPHILLSSIHSSLPSLLAYIELVLLLYA